MTSIQAELWVDRAGAAVVFYQAAFGARVLHCVGAGDDIVAQLSVGDAAFWVTAASSSMKPSSLRRSTEPQAGRCSSSTIPSRWWPRRWRLGPPKRQPLAASTAGVLGGSSIDSGTSGKSASLSARGRRLSDPPVGWLPSLVRREHPDPPAPSPTPSGQRCLAYRRPSAPALRLRATVGFAASERKPMNLTVARSHECVQC